jgi:GT2 family glycosyltransferase
VNWRGLLSSPFDSAAPPVIALVILTYKKADMLEALLETVSKQKTDFFVEVVVADNGCFEATRTVVASSFAKFSVLDDTQKTYAYAPICNNPGYAMGNNNRAVKEGWVSQKAKWLLFLNDDVTLHPNFWPPTDHRHTRRIAATI